MQNQKGFNQRRESQSDATAIAIKSDRDRHIFVRILLQIEEIVKALISGNKKSSESSEAE